MLQCRRGSNRGRLKQKRSSVNLVSRGVQSLLEIKEKKVLKLKEWTINDNNDLIAVRTEERTIQQQTRVSRKAKKIFPGFL